jgi:hypothetical protein
VARVALGAFRVSSALERHIGSQGLAKLFGNMQMKWTISAACLLAAAAPMAHASAIRAKKLPIPKTVTCLQVKQPFTYTTSSGLFHVHQQVELGRGPYVSEREDASGVYYRAPTNAITYWLPNKKSTSVAGLHHSFEGGIYVPNDPSGKPRLYVYYGTQTIAHESKEQDAECGALTYSLDPKDHSVSVWGTGFGIGTGIGLSMAAARINQPHVHMSAGQAAASV